MSAPSPIPWRALLALSAAVFAAHLILLSAANGPLRIADPFRPRALITRTISIAAPPAPQITRAQPHMAAPVSAISKRAPVAEQNPREPTAVANALAAADFQAPLQVAAPAAPPPEPALPQAADTAAGTPEAAHLPRETGPQPSAFAIPGSVRLEYKVTAQIRQQLWQVNGELLWRHDGENYEAKLELSAPLLPTRTQRSTGRITSQGLAPLRFSDKARSEEAAHFQRDKGKISFSSNRPDAPLLAGAQDRLSVMLQLGAMIAGDPAKFPSATTIEIQTASTRDAELWLFTVIGTEELQLPGGPVSALKLIRNPRREFDQKVELWLAPAMDYAPVRLRLTQPNGDWADQLWSSTDRA
jgi:hypothetical protein